MATPWVWFNGDDYIWVNSEEYLDGPIRSYSAELRGFLITLAYLANESKRKGSVVGVTPEAIMGECHIGKKKYSKYISKLVGDGRVVVEENGMVIVIIDEQMEEPNTK